MNGRAWTGREVWRLLDLSCKAQQRTAARLLGRSPQAVAAKAKRSGLPWRKGLASAAAIAKSLGCSPATARKAAEALEFKAVGKGNGRRFLLDYEQSQQLAEYLITRLNKNAQQRAAGKLRHERKRTQ